MAHPISRDWVRVALLRHGVRRLSATSEQPDAGPSQDTMQQAKSMKTAERARDRVWRAISWVLLANVFFFWLMTCVTAFAQTPPGWAGVYLMYSSANGSLTYTLDSLPPPGWRSEGIHFRVKTDGGNIDGAPAVALQKLILPGLNRVALTANADEATSLRAQGWLTDGTLGYVATTQTISTQALHRIAHDALKLNLYTTKAPNKNFPVGSFGWRYAGIVGYVAPAVATGSGSQGSGLPPPSMPSAPVTPPAVVDASYRDAARFLTQATFGPKPSSIERVKAIGVSAWIDEQLARTAESHMAYIDAAKARRLATSGKAYYIEEDSYEAVWQQWLFGQDELRARMTFALSELMVISNIAPDLEPDAMSSYWDMLNAHAFGTYRDLLGAVALHPAMGYYLNMLGSEKEDAAHQKFPNENFAREVLQLFSVGLYQLNADGSRKVDGTGVPLATYDESVVKGFARAFTGWTFFGNDPANPKKFDRPEESWTQPMIAFPSKHEPGTKKLLNGVLLPAGQTPQQDLKDALDNIANHPNVGPFVGRQLIQRFVTSNPSPAYVARVAAVFDNNGRGVRGDLGAVIKAVLTDPDARGSATLADPKFGKQREPVIRLANILRAFNATSKNGRNAIHYLDSADDALGQSPLLSPSVFNFFSPSYTRPGKLAQAGMVAPEFQITNEIQTVGTANFFYELVKREGYGSGDSLLKLDLTQAKALANSPAALVDYLSSLLTYGDLSLTSRQTIIDAVNAVPFNSKDSERTWRVRTALTLFALSSDFVIQK